MEKTTMIVRYAMKIASKDIKLPKCVREGTVSGSFLSANAVCLICGSTKENSETAFCINDHDDWLESNDEMERFEIASKRFGVPIEQIVSSIKNGIDLVVVSE